jgi:8-oxo-dGTP diphosphatase
VVNDRLVGIVRTSRGVFLPGGGADEGETLEDAAVRETREETGLIVRVTGEIGTADEYVHSEKYSEYFCKNCTFFSASVLSRIDDYEDDHELIWETPKRATELLTHGSQRWAVGKFMKSCA